MTWRLWKAWICKYFDHFRIKRDGTTKTVKGMTAAGTAPHLHLLTSEIRPTAETSENFQKDCAIPYLESEASLARTHGNHGGAQSHDTMTLRKQLFVVSSELKNNKRTTRLLRLMVSDGPEVREEGR